MLVVLMLPCTSLANTIVGTPFDWDTNPTDEDDGLGSWTTLAESSDASLSEIPSGAAGNPSDWMKIDFENQADSGSATAKADATELFVGTWQPEYWIEFDFWAEDQTPTTLEVRWHAATSERIWGNTVSPSSAAVGGWETLKSDTFSGDLGNWDEYSGSGGSTEDFLDDLNQLDWIGVYVNYGGSGDGSGAYGIDDYKLMVPEPEEYLMLAAALVTACLVLRRRTAVVPVSVKR